MPGHEKRDDLRRLADPLDRMQDTLNQAMEKIVDMEKKPPPDVGSGIMLYGAFIWISIIHGQWVAALTIWVIAAVVQLVFNQWWKKRYEKAEESKP